MNRTGERSVDGDFDSLTLSCRVRFGLETTLTDSPQIQIQLKIQPHAGDTDAKAKRMRLRLGMCVCVCVCERGCTNTQSCVCVCVHTSNICLNTLLSKQVKQQPKPVATAGKRGVYFGQLHVQCVNLCECVCVCCVECV